MTTIDLNEDADEASAHLQAIEECEEHDSLLNNWERQFLDSIGNQIQKGNPLNQTQVDKLQEIWNKVMNY